MDKSDHLLLDMDTGNESEATNQMLKERLLPNEEPGINLDGKSSTGQTTRSISISSSQDGVVSKQLEKIQPVKVMTLRGDAVRHVITEDGRPPPELSDMPFRIDIVMWVPCMYVGEIMGSLAMASFMIWSMYSEMAVIGSSNNGLCKESLGFATYFLAALTLIKTILSMYVAIRLFLHSSRNRESRF